MDDILNDLGDVSLDSVFGNGDTPVENAPAIEPDQNTPAAPETPAAPFLRTATGTVYNSVEDAIKGTEHKDALIAKMRQEAIERTGLDPVTGQPVQRQAPAVSYAQDGDKYVTDLTEAVSKGDKKAYAKVQQKFVEEMLSPYAPMIAGFAKNQAIETIAAKNPEIRNFIGSDNYQSVLEQFPVLKNAIGFAESNPSQGADLASFYDMANKISLAGKLSEAVRAPQGSPQVRPTVQSGVTVPPPSSSRASTPSMQSADGRKSIIDQFERAGGLDKQF